MSQAGIYFYKYEQGNYFLGIDYVDRIHIDFIPEDGIPLFDRSTEEVGGILEPKFGEFDLNLGIDTATNGSSMQTFFLGGNYKYLVVVFFGNANTLTSPYTYFLGWFTSDMIEYGYVSRKIHVRAKPMEEEVEAALSTYLVGAKTFDSSVDSFLVNEVFPGSMRDYLTVTKSFTSYASLIGDTSVRVSKDLQASGAWINSLNSWTQFKELMQGLGLYYRVRIYYLSSLNSENPEFEMNIFNFDSMGAVANDLVLFGDPQLTRIFSNKKWFYLQYRNWDLSGLVNPAWLETETIQDGVLSDGSNTYNADAMRIRPFPTTASPTYYPLFETSPSNFNGVHYNVWGAGTLAQFTPDEDATAVELPQYTYTYDFEGGIIPLTGAGKTICFARIVCGTGFSNLKVQAFAIEQYRRYMLAQKKCYDVKVLWDVNHYYDIFQTVNLMDEARERTYYISRIQNIQHVGINGEPPTAELTLIEI